MLSFTALIRDIGVHKLAAAFGIEAAHVRVMRARDSIPPEYWDQLIAEGERAGLTGIDFASLRSLRSKRFAVTIPATPSHPTENEREVA